MSCSWYGIGRNREKSGLAWHDFDTRCSRSEKIADNSLERYNASALSSGEPWLLDNLLKSTSRWESVSHCGGDWPKRRPDTRSSPETVRGRPVSAVLENHPSPLGSGTMSRLLASTIFVFSIAAALCAQVQTGSILIKVTDQQGAILPGVSVTLSGSALVAGSMTGVTNEGGMQRFPSLVPGTYTVKLELPSFQTVVRENVNVNIGEQLLQATPGGRDIWGLLEGKVPGLVMSRPDVGGTSGGLQGSYSARGTTSGQNSQFLNGVNVGDPAAIGAAGYYYDFDAAEDIQVSTGAHDISVPTGGVFLNMVTKTGGDKWSGRTTFTWLGQGTQSRNVDPSLYKYGFTPAGNTSDFVSDVNVSAGGPLVKDKLRFFGSFRDWRVHQNVPVANAQTVLDQTNITSGLGNVTWQLG